VQFHAKYPLFDSQSERGFTFSYAILGKSGFAGGVSFLAFYLATITTPMWIKKKDSKQHLLQQWLYAPFSSF